MNTIDDAIQAFAEASDAPPNEALQWALDHWDEAVPRFLAMLEGYTDGSDDTEPTLDAMFFIVHLLGDRGDQRAYQTLCRLMLDEEKLVSALGDEACVSTLKGVLIKCFDGDPAPLRAVVESTEAESITRGEALLALAWLARDGRIPEAEFRTYVGELFQTMQPREPDYIWYTLIVTAAMLGYQEFAGMGATMIRDGLVPEEWLTLAEYPDLMATGDPEGKNGLQAEEVEPFGNIIESLAEWPWDEPFDEEEEAARTPVINPLRHIGRNDPCPCGSGKKFKNCHLVAE
ncbi:MAG: DUF1186 domain-containing protein [Acetobacteraceae bacterium]|nr:DUF1186 domain-containing protein [Acetobacteraceae bacterium]